MSKRSLMEEMDWQSRRNGREPLHKRQLVAEVARRTSLTQAQVCEALNRSLEVIAETMAAGDHVTLVGFGRFEAREHQPRTVTGLDGNPYLVKSRLVPSFRPYPSLRRWVQEQAAEKLAIEESRGGDPCPEPRASTERLTVKVTKHMLADLNNVASKSGEPMSVIVRQAIRNYLDGTDLTLGTRRTFDRRFQKRMSVMEQNLKRNLDQGLETIEAN